MGNKEKNLPKMPRLRRGPSREGNGTFFPRWLHAPSDNFFIPPLLLDQRRPCHLERGVADLEMLYKKQYRSAGTYYKVQDIVLLRASFAEHVVST